MYNFVDIMIIIITLLLFTGVTLFIANLIDKDYRLKDKKYKKIRVYNSSGKLIIEPFEAKVIIRPHYLTLKDKDNRIIFPGNNIVIIDEIKEDEESV